MNATSIFVDYWPLVAGYAAGLCLLPLVWILLTSLSVANEDEAAVVVLSFGKVKRVIKSPGLHLLPQKVLPWTRVIPVSLQKDFRYFSDIHINDRRGTTVIVDLWIEMRLEDPGKALFQVEDWEESLKSLLIHSAASILGTRDFSQILSNRTELGKLLQKDIEKDTARWGLVVEMVFVSKLSLLPEVSQLLFATVAARLEHAKMDIEEHARLRIGMLEAETNAKVAALVAEAKGQYPLAVSRSYQKMRRNPEAFVAYKELYDLSLSSPERMVTFQGFEGTDLSPLDAAMLSPSLLEASQSLNRGGGARSAAIMGRSDNDDFSS